jgi:hypothetical protein
VAAVQQHGGLLVLADRVDGTPTSFRAVASHTGVAIPRYRASDSIA